MARAMWPSSVRRGASSHSTHTLRSYGRAKRSLPLVTPLPKSETAGQACSLAAMVHGQSAGPPATCRVPMGQDGWRQPRSSSLFSPLLYHRGQMTARGRKGEGMARSLFLCKPAQRESKSEQKRGSTPAYDRG
eukprot:CAMPEP_0195060950 /NCGR_PEP_ID=MMETSP0448-20130528/8098_1 /TAXON_ID=66468 /ORGANISM="Heterocapsa triquestra, Strain CCMP 448" /LENGTH=132 /DNA_ID=CAMNT_0040091471 /DNA_START=81 /DNA_END=479 /DNA_ORIENTATION=-